MATATLDFNDLFPASYVDDQAVQTPSIVEDGFELGGLGYPFFAFYSLGSGTEAGAYNGPGVIYNPGGIYQPTTLLTHPDGTPFDIQSIKLDYAYTNFTTPRPAIVTFVGTKPDQSTVSTTFTTDTQPGLQTFTFGPQFTNLTSVAWNSETTFDYVVTDPEFGESTATDYQSNQFDDIVLRYGPATPTPPPVVGAAVTVGSGPDTLVLQLQQDTYQGNAQYTVSLDGAQVGATQNAQATRASGVSDTLTVRADLAAGPHRVTINFLNDAYGGTSDTDRNLFVNSGTYNGAALTFTARQLMSNGPATIDFAEAGTTPPATGASTTVGSGSDTLVFKLQQDPYEGSAQYTVKIDGAQVGGVLTASATRASGLFDTLTVLGNLAPGAHSAEINFLNDRYDGSAATDRNLYVSSGTYNGEAIPFTTRQLLSPGPTLIDFQEPSPPGTTPPAAGASVTVGSGSDTLVLKLSQDAYQGNAQYTVSLDGAQVGGVLTASATRASGLLDTLTVRADLAPGAHRVAVNFLNDRYDGSAATDRNLYVESGTYNGDTIAFTAKQLLSSGPAFIDFTEVAPSTPPATGVSATVGSGSDALVLKLQQDAYGGSAQYTVSLDGTQVGGVLTASATRDSGLFDTLTVRANLAPGAHRVAVNFLNDRYDGTAATDRNLYVESGTYNGATVAGAKVSLFSTGPAEFNITDIA